ncbi:MAG TPA: rhomboid family intramembrane serine protease [Planctomycetota bacterium]|jgi:membrane associated rhomboid family serine protease|nr:rhomboid family intramembrane serine protease [Planctomycetota bacterium]
MPAWEDVSPYTESRTRIHRFSWTNLLIILNLAGFVATGFLQKNNPEALSWLEFDKTAAIGQFRVWQFVTYSFIQMMEAGFIPWLILGIYTLYTIGNELEADLGSARYLTLYFASVVYGALFHAGLQYFVPAFLPSVTMPAAATLCAPVLGITATAAQRWPRRPVLLFFFLPLRLRTAALVLGIGWILCACWMQEGLGPSLGALVAAAAVGTLEPRIDRAFERARLRRDRDRFVEEVDIRRRTDAILDKITRAGMGSLTRGERKTLQQASELFGRGKEKPHE